MKRHVWIIVVLAGLLGLGAGAGVRYWQGAGPGTDALAAASGEGSDTERETVIGQGAPAFELPNLAGETVGMQAFEGEVVLLNFWATWCPPCVEEMPALAALQERLGGEGLQVVGVALDDAEAVRGFADEHGIDYPLLVGARDAFEIARAYGNPQGTLPYTVVVDRSGTIRATHQGALTEAEAARLVQSLL